MPKKVGAKQEDAHRGGLCLRTEFGRNALEGAADSIDTQVADKQLKTVHFEPTGNASVFTLLIESI